MSSDFSIQMRVFIVAAVITSDQSSLHNKILSLVFIAAAFDVSEFVGAASKLPLFSNQLVCDF